jgi:predicted nucleic acid-binding protein
VALINQRDEHHVEATAISPRFVGRPLLTTDAVLVEIGNALARNFKVQAAAVIEFFQRAANIDVITTTPAVFSAAFSLYQTHSDKSWGMTDCISFVAMRQAAIQDVLTHDRHFTQAGFNTLLSSR